MYITKIEFKTGHRNSPEFIMSSAERIGEISVKRNSEVEWTIKNIFSYTVGNKSYFSPQFDVSGSQWNLDIRPNSDIHNGWIGLYLHRESDDSSSLLGANYHFGVKRADGTVEKLRSNITCVLRDGFGFGSSALFQRSTLLQRKSELAPLDALTLTCNLWVTKRLDSFSLTDTLSQNFADLFSSKEGCDVTLNVQGEKIPVHKFILAARSPVFAAMFKSDMKEKNTGVVEIEDCDPDAFKEFLAYLYSGKAENLPSNAIRLCKIADKYGVRELRAACLISIMGNLSTENVLDAAVLGEQLSEKALKIESQEFFNKHFGKIVSTAEWLSFLKSHLLLANEYLKEMGSEINSPEFIMSKCHGAKRVGQISVKRNCEVEWTIKNIFSYTVENKSYMSPRFDVSGSRWYLQTYPDGQIGKDYSAGCIGLYLNRDADDSSTLQGANYHFSVKKADGTVEKLGKGITKVFGKKSLGCPALFQISTLLQWKSELAPLDVLTLTCNLWVYESVDPFSRTDTLSQNFADLFFSKEGCDVTLEVQQKKIPVHRCILAARSAVFAAMFKSDMKEKNTGVVKIKDCDPEVFKDFLAYLYSGEAENLPSNAIGLCKVADKYGVIELKAACLISIMGNLSTENVLDAAVLGEQLSEQALQIESQKFFNKHFGKIVSTAEWDSFLKSHLRLANEYLKKMGSEM